MNKPPAIPRRLDGLMKKNKNIFLHIIDEDYRAKKQEQSGNTAVSGKAIQLTDQKDGSVLERLRRMHGLFEETNKAESPELTNVTNQATKQDTCEIKNSLEISELYRSYQKITIEEQELVDRKQDLQLMEQELRVRLLEEMGKKKKSIEALHLEIEALQNTCDEISENSLTYPS